MCVQAVVASVAYNRHINATTINCIALVLALSILCALFTLQLNESERLCARIYFAISNFLNKNTERAASVAESVETVAIAVKRADLSLVRLHCRCVCVCVCIRMGTWNEMRVHLLLTSQRARAFLPLIRLGENSHLWPTPYDVLVLRVRAHGCNCIWFYYFLVFLWSQFLSLNCVAATAPIYCVKSLCTASSPFWIWPFVFFRPQRSVVYYCRYLFFFSFFFLRKPFVDMPVNLFYHLTVNLLLIMKFMTSLVRHQVNKIKLLYLFLIPNGHFI